MLALKSADNANEKLGKKYPNPNPNPKPIILQSPSFCQIILGANKLTFRFYSKFYIADYKTNLPIKNITFLNRVISEQIGTWQL